jgi:hypothetical protein
VKLWSAAAASAVVGWALKLGIAPSQPVVAGIVILGPYGAVYLAAAYGLGIAEVVTATSRLRRFVSR